jgi:hypothetical protein
MCRTTAPELLRQCSPHCSGVAIAIPQQIHTFISAWSSFFGPYMSSILCTDSTLGARNGCGVQEAIASWRDSA